MLTHKAATELKATGVELTLRSATLNLTSQEGLFDLALSAAAARELRADMARMTGFKVDSRDTPVLLFEVKGMGKRSNTCARMVGPTDLETLPDCQLQGVAIELKGNRLIIAKGDRQTFIQLTDQSRDVCKDQIPCLK